MKTQIDQRNKAIKFALYLLPFMLNIALIDFIIPIKYEAILNNLPLFGMLVTLAWFGSTFLDFAIGDLTDKLGVKKTLIIGALLSFIGAMIFGLTSNIALMTFGIFLWGLSYCLFAVPSETYVLSSFKKNYSGTAFGILNFILDISYATAPLIGFVIITFFGTNPAIITASIITLLTVILIAKMRNHQRESLGDAFKDVIVKDGLVKNGFKALFKMNASEISLLINVFVCGLWFMTVFIASPLLFLIDSNNLLQGALLTFAFMIPFALMELWFGNIADYSKNRSKMIKYGFFFAALFLVSMFFISNFILLLCAAFLSSFFANMAWVASEVHVSKYLPRGEQGEVTSVFVTARDIGYDFAPLFYGLIAVLGLKMPFLVLGLVLLIAGFFSMITNWKRK
ncbi:Major Facilitator Superfamily protein [uncultured archaeon]|nr:Major Facilitator Superfamily protein [uncultured archaeon]